MRPGDAEELGRRADEYLARRRASQPVEPSAGSIFRNPPGEYAGRLIESLGLKGHQIGGAQVSPRHANFIVNEGGATAEEVLRLAGRIREEARARRGVELELEVRVIGCEKSGAEAV